MVRAADADPKAVDGSAGWSKRRAHSSRSSERLGEPYHARDRGRWAQRSSDDPAATPVTTAVRGRSAGPASQSSQLCRTGRTPGRRRRVLASGSPRRLRGRPPDRGEADVELTSTDHSDTLSHIKLAGRLDIPGVDRIETRFNAMTVARGRDAMVDMEAVTWITSMGIRMLVTAAKSLRARGRRLVL